MALLSKRHTAASLAAVLMASAAPVAARAADLPGYFVGGASSLIADPAIGPLSLQLMRLAGQGCPCAGSNGRTLVSRVGPVSITGLLSVGASASTSTSQRGTTQSTEEQTASVSGLSLLGGLIQARAIKADAQLTATAGGFTTSAANSKLVGLKIAGQRVPGNVPPNTTIPVPGLGSAVVNEQVVSGDGVKTETLLVQMIDITVQVSNSFGFPIGAHIAVGHAAAGYDRTALHAVVGGQAYIATANVTALNVLPSFSGLGGIGVTCAGTGGVTKTNTFAGITQGPISIGAGTTTAYGTTGNASGTGATAQTTATIGSISLLGLIGADGVSVGTTETLTAKGTTRKALNATFTNLVVAGVSIPENPPPNTMISVPLVGTLVVNEQIPGNPKFNLPATVNALHLMVSLAVLGLPAGTDITIGHADALARPLP